MKRILLVNPPIYDFTAYDFWLKPLGMLSAAGGLGPLVDMRLFDFLDRLSPSMPAPKNPSKDPFSRGSYHAEKIDKPAVFKDIPRHFRRFGIPREVFRQYLADSAPLDIVLIQSTMTYWYLGIKEVIEDIRKYHPNAKIVLGGFYASLLPDHARSLGAGLIIQNSDLQPLYDMVGVDPTAYQPPAWNLYPRLSSAVMKLTHGCPFACTYCAVGQRSKPFAHRPLNHCIADLQALIEQGTADIAFYDDALLYQLEKLLIPFLNYVIENNIKVNFHTPNALHARYITGDLAKLMVDAGFKTFYLGFESSSDDFHKQTGAKVISADLTNAVAHLTTAGANPNNIAAYEIIGHPHTDLQHLEESIRFANSLKIRVMLSDFSPIPTTPDGDICNKIIDLAEPLNHNKTAFPIRLLGDDKVNLLKSLCKSLNRSL